VKFVCTELPGVIIVEPDIHHDGRGYFLETYHAEKYRAGGIEGPFVQDNHSRSIGRTVRGLHLQIGRPQGKLIRVIEGEIYDVAVDVRRGSPTFGRWVGVTLSAGNFRQCYVPPGFAHGFSVVSPIAQVEYKCTDLYDRKSEIGVAWNDPALAIAWPPGEAILSDRDRRHPTLAQLGETLPIYSSTNL
jgi:dTDP-4-dehydrorhamnose 3,5-epimerase